MARLSGLQKEVIHFYRKCIRGISTKPKDSQQNFREFIRGEFGRFRNISKRDFSTIEHLLRTGFRRYDMFAIKEVKNVH
ncbi:Sdh6 protein [Saccharomycopsis crataegensis]|uniref:Sdh6 protein n=1 Tax=Saccharomycopsis crataegensis TaxID=43959 RepID=A0AAV5QMC6_9ASCO|nr:Sdh6 protein [Saccharomycopsis crataegensis]